MWLQMKVTSKHPLPLSLDIDIGASFDIYKEEQLRLLNLSWKHDTAGNECKAQKYYKAASIHTLLATYAGLLATSISRGGFCTLKENFKVTCVEANLPCLSREYDTDFVTTWKKLKAYYSIDLNEACEDCCVGIAKMIINEGECEAFTVGPCN